MTGVGERRGPLRRAGHWLTTPVRTGWRWLTAQKSLGHALVIVVAIGLLGAFVAWVAVSWILGQGLPWTTAPSSGDRIELTKLALTVVGGAGAIVALTVAYRRQKDIEDGRFTERFGAAAAQLGAPTPAERLAGVYAMAGVADRYPTFAQQCIDVLCGYLRLPFDPDPAETHLTGIVVHRKVKANGPDVQVRSYERLPNDREVRDSIVRVIADHVRADRETGWHKNDFDLTGATLTTAPFSKSHFRGTLDCTRTRFTADASFSEATFTADTRFGEATFTEVAAFFRATFNADAQFEEATFTGVAAFERVTFNADAWFVGATFTRVAWFDTATFTGLAGFTRATFNADARFDTATFTGDARFDTATFIGDARFLAATFIGDARFLAATFTRLARFDRATFTGRLTRQDGTTTEGTDMPLGPALGFPDSETEPEPAPESG